MLIHKLIRLCSNMPYYAVKSGRNPGIYKTWKECEEQVKGFAGARYKKFNSEDEARNFTEQSWIVSLEDNFFYNSYCGYSIFLEGIEGSLAASTSLGVKKTTNFKIKTEIEGKLKVGKQTKLIPLEATMKHEFITRSTFPTSPVVYTDGCCLGNGTDRAIGGIGVYWAPQHPRNISEYLDVYRPTNQKAELRAAARALESAIEMNLPSVELRTDSKYTIKSMTEWISNWERNGWKTSQNTDVENKDEMIRLSNLCKRISITWVHTPGHQGVYGNEQADQLANAGALLGRN